MEDKHAQITNWVEQHRDNIVSLAQTLVQMPTENKPPHGAELECQNFVADFMRDLGCQVDMFQPDEVPELLTHSQYWPGRDYTDRPNVVGVMSPRSEIHNERPASMKSLMFSGHIDVVPAHGEGKHPWWEGEIADGKLYGRGSNDMKGGIAAFLTAARCIKELGLQLKGDLILETVVDEESGGANGTLASRLRGYNADAAILPEPNNMCISTAHRGGQQFRVKVTGESKGMAFGESVLVDPIAALAHIIVALEKLNQEFNARPKPPGFEQDTFPLMLFVLRAGEVLPWGSQDANPESAFLEFWIEIPPGVSKEQLQSELKGTVEKLAEVTPSLQLVSVEWEEASRFLSGSSMSDDNPVIDLLASNVSAVTGKQSSREPAPFACDGFMFNMFSTTPVIIFGPRGGNAHAPDEWVDIENLVSLTKTYAMTIADWLG